MTAIRPVSALPSLVRRDERMRSRSETEPLLEDARVAGAAMKIVRIQPDAAVVAQLMATHLDLPQTRRLRRLGAAEGAAAYRAAGSDIDRGRRAAVALPSWSA